MKSNPNSPRDIPKKRLKGPYSLEETIYIQSLVFIGLKKLKNIGKGVNFEQFCSAMGEVPDSIYAPEWQQYCNNLKEKFEKESNEKLRISIFIECIRDLKNRGLLPSDISGLTGKFSIDIFQILSKDNQN